MRFASAVVWYTYFKQKMNALWQHFHCGNVSNRRWITTSHTRTVQLVANNKTCLTSHNALLISVSWLCCFCESHSLRPILIFNECIHEVSRAALLTGNCHATKFGSCWVKTHLVHCFICHHVAKSCVYFTGVDFFHSYKIVFLFTNFYSYIWSFSLFPFCPWLLLYSCCNLAPGLIQCLCLGFLNGSMCWKTL